jgi:hypothetical protein
MKTATPDFRKEHPKKLIYVAHSGESAKYTKYIMRFVYECGCIPLSIFEAFDYWFQVEFYRGHKALCLHDDISVMLRCDELWVFHDPKQKRAKLKKGVQAEIDAWKKYKDPKENPVRFCTWKKIGVPKFADPPKWVMPFKQCPEIPDSTIVSQKRILLSPPMPPPDCCKTPNQALHRMTAPRRRRRIRESRRGRHR